jgi:hypothetical protein
MVLKILARWIIRSELAELRGTAGNFRRFFHAWRVAARHWESYAHYLEEKYDLDEDFNDFFWTMTAEERKDPAPSDYVPGFTPRRGERK